MVNFAWDSAWSGIAKSINEILVTSTCINVIAPWLKLKNMDDFYVTLASNVPNPSEPNTTARFRTMLPKNVNLEGRWVVALKELQIPFSFNNVDNDLIQIRYTRNQHVVVIDVHVERNFYHSVEELVTHINFKIHEAITATAFDLDNYDAQMNGEPTFSEILKDELYAKIDSTNVIDITYDAIRQRVAIKLPSQDVVSKISISSRILYLLGFGTNEEFIVMTDAITTAKFPPDMSAGLSSIFIYTDLIAPQIVGNSLSQVLQYVLLL